MKIKDFLYIYAIGCIGYSFVEVLWRGHTHWSMGIVGGICFTVMYLIDGKFENSNIYSKALLSAICVTGIEFISGIILNRYLHMNVWDYSGMKFNFLGQISLLYSIFWFFLCIPCHMLCKILRHRVFGVLSQSRYA
ncbi:MAG: hypothetical protein IJ002_04190 [Clostridia bacterium]|nr:hypothetical protein [Clostridia bacterium]